MSATSPPLAVLDELLHMGDRLVAGIDGATHVTVNIVDDNKEWTTVFTHPDAEVLAEIDRNAGGPTLETYLSGRVVHIRRTTDSEVKWPEYSVACRRQGIYSVASFPIAMNRDVLGVLTVASNDYCGFGVEETRLGIAAAAEAAKLLGDLA